MAVETEIERMVVRLVAEADQYIKALDASIAKAEQAMQSSVRLQETNKKEADFRSKMAAAEAEFAASMARSQSQQAALQARGASVTQQYATATERQSRAMAEIRDLYSQGAISAQTYGRVLEENKRQVQAVAAAEAARKTNRIGEVGGAIAGAGAAVGLIGGGLAMGGLMTAARYENTTVAFKTMLGSAAEAKRTLADLTRFAAEIPFEMPEIEQAARGLIQFGERGSDMMKTLKSLGDAASATKTDFGFLALVFNQIRGVGHLLTQDFRQLSSRGILSLQDLANHFKVPIGEAQKMLSSGKISFEDVRKIFENLSKDGGRFANMMKEQSTTLTGLWSTLKDQTGLTLRAAMEPVVPVVKTLLEYLIRLGKWFYDAPQWIKATAGVVLSLSTGLGAVLTTTGGVLLVVNQMINAYRALRTALIGTTIAQAALNATQQQGAVVQVTGVAAGAGFMKGAAGAGVAGAAKGGLGRLGTAGLIVGAGTAAAIGANQLGSYMFGMDDRIASMDKGRDAAADLGSRHLTRLDKMFDMSGDASNADQLKNQQASVATYEKEYDGVRSQLRRLKEEAADYGFLSRNMLDSAAYEDLQKQIKATEERADEMNEKLVKQKAHLKDLEILSKVPASERERSKEFDAKEIAVLKEKVALSQMLPENQLRYKADKAGANQAQVDEYVKLSKELEGNNLRTKIGEMNDDFALQQTMIGKTADEMKILKLRMEDADNEAVDLSKDIDALEASMKAYHAAEEAHKNRETGKKMLADAKERYEAAKIGKQAYDVAKAVENGQLTQDEADQYVKYAEGAKQEEARTKLLEDAKNGLREAQYRLNEELRVEDQIRKAGLSKEEAARYRDTVKQTKALQEELKMVDEAKAIHEKYASSTEKMAEKKDKLDDLFSAQLISAREYTEAMKDLDKEFSKKHTAEFDLKGIDAVAAGSADAISHLTAFRAATNKLQPRNRIEQQLQAKNNGEHLETAGTKQEARSEKQTSLMEKMVELLVAIKDKTVTPFLEAGVGS